MPEYFGESKKNQMFGEVCFSVLFIFVHRCAEVVSGDKGKPFEPFCRGYIENQRIFQAV